MEINREMIERLIEEILARGAGEQGVEQVKARGRACAGKVLRVSIPQVRVTQEDRLETGKAEDKVYTRDVFSLEESPRLGCGVMEMEDTEFDW